MTKRTPHGYQHPNAYRTWLPEQEDILRIVALKGRDSTALKHTMGLESLAVVLGRSPSSIAKKAVELEITILSNEQLEIELAMCEKDGESWRNFL